MDIVVHSFRLLFTNLGDALKVSVGPYLLAIVACVAVLAAAGVPMGAVVDGSFDATAVNGGSVFLAVIACFLIIIFVSGWVAVSWHRFVLLEEYPGLLPSLSGRPVWPYVGRVLLLSLILVLVAIPLGFVMGLVAVPFVQAGSQSGGIFVLFLIGIVTGTILSFLWMRLALVLPAIAVGKPVGMGDSWRMTAPQSGSIFVAVLIIMALNIGTGVLFGWVLGPGGLTTVLSTVVDWISIMVGISLLTTLYGMIVERRPLG